MRIYLSIPFGDYLYLLNLLENIYENVFDANPCLIFIRNNFFRYFPNNDLTL